MCLMCGQKAKVKQKGFKKFVEYMKKDLVKE